MDYLWLGAVGAVLAIFLFRRFATRGPEAVKLPVRSPETASRSPAAAPAEPRGAEPVAAPPDMPAELQAFQPVRAEGLSLERQKVMFAVFRKVPRPPRLMQQLLSPDFLNTASSAQLVDLIAAEPLIAAKLLAAVNSPMYGLQRPATGIEQAVIYLGINTVRAICLQYLMIAAFQAEGGARAQRLESIWRASGLASEIAQHLCQEVLLEAPGTTTSAVVLSFLGQLGVAGAAPETLLAKIPRGDFLARTQAEQETLGLSAGEIGRLLMIEWELPAAVVRKAADIDGILTRPADGIDPDRDARLALGYFCARAGERLASGQLLRLDGLAFIDEAPADFFHFRSYLAHAPLKHLDAALKSPALAARLERMLGAMRR